MAALTKRIRTARKCIFCDNGKLTREHIWPEWAAPLLDGRRDPTYYDVAAIYDRYTGVVSDSRRYTRQGPVNAKRLPVVCGGCNSGWMSGLEEAVRPILVPMALGRPRRIRTEDQATLAAWIAMKVIVAEHNILPGEVTLRAEREHFRQKKLPPDGWQITLWRCGEPPWRVRWDRHAMTCSHEDGPEAAPGLNTQDVTFGFADLLVNVFSCRVPELEFKPSVAPEHGLQLWPPTGDDLDWPPGVISAEGAQAISEAAVQALRRVP